MTRPGQDSSHLDAAIDSRRQELGLTWKDLAEAAKMTTQSLHDIRVGRSRPRRLTKHRLEVALHWQSGSFDTVEAGGHPTLLGAAPREASRIARALQDSNLTTRKAAERAGLQEDQWDAVISGRLAPAPAVTLARMADVVGLTPRDLEEAGRPDAAAELRLIQPQQATHQDSATPQPAPASVLVNRAELDMWNMDSLSPVERADHIAAFRVRRVTAELREELAELRQQLAEAQRQIATLSQRAS